MNKKKRSQVKVATFTFHIAHNYGAMLQAYALEKTVNNLGYDCEILDYRFPYIDQWSGIRTFRDLVQEYGWFWGFRKYIAKIRRGYYTKQSPAQARFNSFMRSKMKLSKKVYFTAESLPSAKYDALLFGSDQIWNPKLTNGVASEFFGLPFNPEKTRLISYAASCGQSRLPEDCSEQILPMLKRFYALGIRESGFTKYLQTEYHLPAKTVIDPVLLLTVKQWDHLLKGVPNVVDGSYLLIYAFDVDDEIYTLARRISKEKKLPIVTVSYSRNDALSDMTQLTNCGPLEFLWLFRNADFICTSSFHGEAFSILFEKNFYCVGHPVYSQRNVDLLRLVGLSDRLFSLASDINNITSCDFNSVRSIIECEREKAISFICSSIEE